jgi:transcriptional regulator of nitric oxide reductase
MQRATAETPMAGGNAGLIRRTLLLFCLALTMANDPAGQDTQTSDDISPARIASFRAILPGAEFFVRADDQLPHFRAYRPDPSSGETKLVGFVFFTHEVEPYEVAYAGRIDILAGMTVGGVITGIEVLYHDEPYGDFSIDKPEFAAQFAGKSILDPLRVGDDIDSVTRATITVEGATRTIRKSARQIARQHLRESQAQ